MKILYGVTKSNWGGAQKYVFDLATAAKISGNDVAVLAGGNGVLIEKLDEAGIRVISLPYMGRDVKLAAEIKAFVDIYKILKSEKPDVFHINSAKMGGLGIVAGRLARVKEIIFTAHGWTFREPRHWLQSLLIEELSWLTVLGAHKTICVSERDYADMARKPFARKKLVVIHNGISDKGIMRKQSHSGDPLVVGTIAELHRNKGLDVALRAFARAFKYTDTKFQIIGDGEERESLHHLAIELGIDSQVKFLGFKNNATELLSDFNIFILPSRKEGLPYSLLEAGLNSLPVVSTRVGGIPEIIKDGETGLLVPSEDHKALADALKKLSDDSAERKRLGNNLHDLVKKNFSKERMVEETLSLYEQKRS